MPAAERFGVAQTAGRQARAVKGAAALVNQRTLSYWVDLWWSKSRSARSVRSAGTTPTNARTPDSGIRRHGDLHDPHPVVAELGDGPSQR